MANAVKLSDPSRLLPQARVCLLGRAFGTLEVDSALGENGKPERYVVASIQAYTADGRLVQLRTPTLFLVGSDRSAKTVNSAEPDLTQLGLIQLDANMQLAGGLSFWEYDRSDQIARLDSSVGTVQRVVIDLESGASTRRVDAVGQESSWMARLGLDH